MYIYTYKGLEPIVEETYENQRYHPVELQWSLPWTGQLNDPPDWSNALGVDSRNPSTLKLPSDSWEWLERDWKVDLSGMIGKEIDEKGKNVRRISVQSKLSCFTGHVHGFLFM
jgi:hypothetical protein